ncbi:MAG: hypothetical protein ACE5QV_09350, partial [Fidelibacterota bacterium]
RGRYSPYLALANVTLDQFLLERAVEEGAEYEEREIKSIYITSGLERNIYLEIEGKSGVRKFDLVVGAFGLNSNLHNLLKRNFSSKERKVNPSEGNGGTEHLKNIKLNRIKYKPPDVWQVSIAEIQQDEDFVKGTYNDMIQIFTFGDTKVKFISLTPKRDRITVCTIGNGITMDDTKRYILTTGIKRYFTFPLSIGCYCFPNIPVGNATRPYNDRFVVIGDACASRFMKNGIESAFYTASYAVDTVLNHGILAEDFKYHYYPKCKRRYTRDNIYGKIIFELSNFFASNSRISKSLFLLAQRESRVMDIQNRRFSKGLWQIFTGNISYREIFINILHPLNQFWLIFMTLKSVFSNRSSISRGFETVIIEEA